MNYSFLNITSKYQYLTSSHLYHYAGNNPITYTDPNGTDAKNNTQKYIVARIEDEIEVIVDGRTYKVHNIILKPGDYVVGAFDGAMDEYGNMIKVSARSEENVNFSAEIKFDHIYLNITDDKSKRINKKNDSLKKCLNILPIVNLDLSGNYSDQKRIWKPLFSWWRKVTTEEQEPGTPDQWEQNYYSKIQVELRKKLRVINEQEGF